MKQINDVEPFELRPGEREKLAKSRAADDDRAVGIYDGKRRFQLGEKRRKDGNVFFCRICRKYFFY
ncbi:MAG: hypothetical protein ACRCUT_05240 [Spirochaetota bacterium]